MENIPRNVILDLLPAYIAGEASEETKKLIEEYAKSDPQIDKMIKMGELDTKDISVKDKLPKELELKTLNRVRKSIRRQMLYVSLATAAFLSIPFIAMQFTNEVNWDVLDFVIMGVLLLGSGLTYILITKISDKTSYRAGVGIAVLAGFLLIWVNLAVGIIGSENNPANLLYLGIYIIGIVGAVISRLGAKGMSITLFVIAVYQMIIPLIASFIWDSTFDASPGIIGIAIINLFFAMLFIISGFLFRNASAK